MNNNNDLTFQFSFLDSYELAQCGENQNKAFAL